MRLEFEPSATVFPLVDNDAAHSNAPSTSWDFDSLLKKGVAAAQSGDRDLARKVLSQATAINPASEDAWMWLASISDYPEELLAFLNRVLDINPDNDKAVEWRSATNSLLATTFVQRALAARNDGSFDLAEQCLDQALGHDSECESAWFWKASLATSDDQKLEFFARVLSINPENTEASDAIARVKHDQALASLAVAKSLAAAGNREKAVELLDDLVNDDSAEIREAALMTMADIAESEDLKLEFLNRVLAVNAANTAASDAVAAIKKSKSQAAFDEAKSAAAAGDRQKAIEILNDFVKDVPDSVDAWLLKSHLSDSLDEKVEALEKALEIDPENAGARSGLAFLALTFGSSPEPKEEPAQETVQTAADVATPEFVEATPTETLVEEQAEPVTESFSDETVEETQHEPQLTESVEFAYRTTEETVNVEDPVVEASPESMAVEAVEEVETPEQAEKPAVDPDTATNEFKPESDFGRSVEEMFGPVSQADPSGETVDSFSPFVQETLNQDPFAAEPPSAPFDPKVEPAAEIEEVVESPQFQPTENAAIVGNVCPFCSAQNDPQAFECTSCNATLTLADIEKLLSGTNANREVVQNAVTAMEAEWNLRDLSEAELTALGIGQFNLGNNENAFRYLQEASRLSPNNVILAGHVNTIAIRIDEMRRQHETYDAMPKGKKILVVDDSPTVRKLISGKLEKSGHHVVCAVDGVDALAKLEDGWPDLVLLDITMPRMDGYEVCKQIRSSPEGKNLPVVMISGKDGFFDKVRGRMAGTTGYVTKPFGPETLMKALETYLLPDEVEVA